MKTIIYGMILIVNLGIVTAQNSINGVVKTEKGEALPNATVRIINSLKGTVSDVEGNFELRNINTSPIIVECSYIGYKIFRDTIQTSANLIELVVTLKEESFLADALVVTATRVEASAPVGHKNLSKEQIEEMNTGRDVPYVISQTPSVVSSSDAGAGVGYTALRIRGIDQASINVTINGIALNDPESQGVYWVNIPDFSSSLSDIQIQRGVGSSTNGPASFGASINMQTETVNLKPYAELGVSYGSFNTQKTTIKFGSGIFGKYWSVDGRLSSIHSDGYIDRASTDLISYYFSAGFNNAKTTVKLLSFGGKEETYQAWYGVNEATLKTDRTFNPSGAIYDADGNVVDFYENEVDHYDQDHLQLHLDHKISALWRMQASAHFTYGRGYFEQYKQGETLSYYNMPPLNSGDTSSSSDLVVRPWLENRYAGITYNVEYRDDKWKFNFGGAANTYDGDHFGRVMWASIADGQDLNHEYYNNRGLKNEVNSYAKLRRTINKKFTIYADLQYRLVDYTIEGTDEYATTYDLKRSYQFINPKLGLTYQLSNAHQLYYMIGLSNREPTRNDLLFSNEYSATHEILLDNELGYRYEKRGNAFEAGLYYMMYKDQLVPTGAINNVGEAIRENVGESYRAGIEVSASVNFLNNLRWMPNVTLSQNQNVNYYADNESGSVETRNSAIAYAPSVIANNGIQFQPIPIVSFTLYSNYVGQQYLDNNQLDSRSLKAYHVHDFRIEVKQQLSWTRELKLYAMVFNILDQEYESFGYVYGMPYFFPQAGRNFSIGFNAKF